MWNTTKKTYNAFSPKEKAEMEKEALDQLKQKYKERYKNAEHINTTEDSMGLPIHEALLQSISILKDYEVEIRKDASINDTLILSQQF